jgi:hypothetical protein
MSKIIVMLVLVCIAVAAIILVVFTWQSKSSENEHWNNIARHHIYKPPITDCSLFTGDVLYRLGDMVGTSWRYEQGGEDYHYENFPDSIASEYMRTTKKQFDTEVLTDIVRRRGCEDIQENTAVIHLRVGDVIELNPASVLEILTKYTYMNEHKFSNYTPPLKYLNTKISKLRDLGIVNIIIVAGSHIDMATPKSCLYISAVVNYFESEGFLVSTRLGQNADTDFLLMANAKVFIPSTNGWFTRMATAVSKDLGNITL